MILIIGDKGNMGLRYKTILDHLSIPWVGTDRDKSNEEVYSRSRYRDLRDFSN